MTFLLQITENLLRIYSQSLNWRNRWHLCQRESIASMALGYATSIRNAASRFVSASRCPAYGMDIQVGALGVAQLCSFPALRSDGGDSLYHDLVFRA